jgi:hypothetical protein
MRPSNRMFDGLIFPGFSGLCRDARNPFDYQLLTFPLISHVRLSYRNFAYRMFTRLSGKRGSESGCHDNGPDYEALG